MRRRVIRRPPDRGAGRAVRQGLDELAGGRGDPGLQGGVGGAAVAELGIAGIDRGRHRVGAEEPEERPQLVLDDEGVAVPAAGRRDDHRPVGQRRRVDQVEDVLEQAGIGALVDRARHDQGVGLRDRPDQGGAAGAQVVRGVGGAEFRPAVEDVEELDVDGMARGHGLGDGPDEGPRLRRPVGVAAEADDAEAGGLAQGHGRVLVRGKRQAWWQATAWASASGRRAGSSRRQRSVATGQRGWKRQPAGTSVGLGRSPPRGARLALSRGVRHRRDEGAGIRVARSGPQGRGRRALDDAAEIHHQHPVGDVLDHRQVVRDEQVGEPELAAHRGEQVEDLRLDRKIEGRDRLVADDEARLDHQGAGDADALALAAGELVRIARRCGLRQADLVEGPGDPGAALVPAAETVNLERRLEDVADGVARVERGEGVLEHHLRPAAIGAQIAAAEPANRHPVEHDLAGFRFDEAEQALRQARLAAAGFADEADGFPARDRQADAVDRPHPVIGGREVRDREQRHDDGRECGAEGRDGRSRS